MHLPASAQYIYGLHFIERQFILLLPEMYMSVFCFEAREDEGPEGLALVTNRAAERSGRPILVLTKNMAKPWFFIGNSVRNDGFSSAM